MARKTGGRSYSQKVGGLLSLLVVLGLSGCVSASLEDAAPTQPAELGGPTSNGGSETTGAEVDPERDTRFVEEGALRNKSFPTFANTPVVATEQLSAEDKLQLEAEMSAIRAAYGSGGLSEAAYVARMKELNDLARTHGSDAQGQIEN